MWFIYAKGSWRATGVGDFPALEHNRAFSYGDGLFESIVVGHGKLLWLQRHLARLFSGAQQIGLDISVDHSELSAALEKLAHNHQHSTGAGAVWRLYAFRVSEGRYCPLEDRACLMLRTEEAPLPYPQQDKSPLRIGVAEQRKVPITRPEVKRMAALDYVLAAREARMRGWNDALMLNTDGRVVECSSSNIFLVKDKRILTPSLSEGCLPGVMRGLILEEFSSEVGLDPYEQPIGLDECMVADAILLSNARHGIREVDLLGITSFNRSGWGKRLQDQLQCKAYLK
jgi:branched-subunit amino acid aminotransferase/4-amino-4-deoxychorismate lyase